MKNFSSEIKVGLLFLITLIIFGFFAIKVGSFRFPWESEGYKVHVFFDNIAGLEEKAPVRLAGVRIGTVTEIKLENGKARVTAEIEPTIRITKGSTVNVSQMGVMGEKYLEIVRDVSEVYCPEGGDCLAEGDVLNGRPPTSFDQVISTVNSIGHDIKSITSSFRRVIASRDGEQRLENIVANVEKVSLELANILEANQSNMRDTMENLKDLTASIKDLVNNNSDNFSQTMGNLGRLTEALADRTPQLIDRLDTLAAHINELLPEEGETVARSLQNIQEATADLRTSMASMRNIVQKIDEGEGTIGKLISDDQTHKNLNTALTSLDKTLEEARDVLGRVQSYKTSLGYRAEYLGDGEEWKHFISLKIQPRHDKYYLLEVVDSPAGSLSETTTHTFTTTNSSVTGEETIEVWKEEKKVEDKFLLNLQIAKEFHNLTFRAGLTETHGGVGIDLGLWKKNVLMSLDGYDFGRDDYSFHLKLSGRISVYHGIYLVGGWDDLLNEEIDSYFVGAGVLFTDEDLKYLLGIAATASSSL